MSALFPSLPVQRPPDILYADQRVLEPCIQCGGSGRHIYTYYCGWYYFECGSEPCRGCHGAGKRVRFVGRCSGG